MSEEAKSVSPANCRRSGRRADVTDDTSGRLTRGNGLRIYEKEFSFSLEHGTCSMHWLLKAQQITARARQGVLAAEQEQPIESIKVNFSTDAPTHDLQNTMLQDQIRLD